MLDHLQERISLALAGASTATVSTWGPAGLQAGIVPCEAVDHHLYLLVPRTSDLLANLEGNPAAGAPAVVITTAAWQLLGAAAVVSTCPPGLRLIRQPEAAWSQVVRVVPARLHITPADPRACAETIDIF
jgi:hypothetical protein